MSWSRRFAGGRWALVVVWLLIALYALTFSAIAIRRHDTFGSHGYDLGNVDQAVWNTAHGRPLAFTNMDPVQNRLALHFEPILLLIAPSYWLYDSPKTLLVVQAMVVALGALPAFWLACDRLKSRLAGVVFALAYLLFPALEAANVFDFHAVSLATPFLLFAFYYLQKRAYWFFAVFSLLAMSCKEEMALVVLLMGLYVLVVQRDRRVGALTVLAGAVWFGLAVFVIAPRFSPIGEQWHLQRYAWLGDTPWQMIATLFTRPDVVWHHLWNEAGLALYLRGLLMPVAFLPLLSPLTLALALPSLAVNLLSSDAFMWRLEEFHYGVPIVPIVIVSAIYGTRTLADWIKRLGIGPVDISSLALVILAFSLGYHYFRGFSPLAVPFQWPPITAHHRLAQQFIEHIPPEAAVMAQSNLQPHVSHRRQVYQELERDDIEYVWLDVASSNNENGMQEFIHDTVVGGDTFGVVAAADGYLLLRRGVSRVPLSDDFYTFVRVADSSPQYPVRAAFGDAVELLGFDVLTDRQEEPRFNLYFQIWQPLEPDHSINLYLLDENGAPIGATDRPQPALVWYPTSQWQPGETVRVVVNTLPWYTRDRRAFGVALGVVDGTDPWAVGARMRPRVVTSPLAVRLPADGTLLRLMTFRRVWGMVRLIGEKPVFRHPKVAHPLSADLGGKVRLVGYDLEAGNWKLETGVHLTLYWQTLAEMDTSYTVFVHLLDGSGQVRGQRDGVPLNSAYPTTLWQAGEFVTDHYEIVVEPGEYTVEVGMYEAASGARLLVTGSAEDRVLLGKVTVR